MMHRKPLIVGALWAMACIFTACHASRDATSVPVPADKSDASLKELVGQIPQDIVTRDQAPYSKREIAPLNLKLASLFQGQSTSITFTLGTVIENYARVYRSVEYHDLNWFAVYVVADPPKDGFPGLHAGQVVTMRGQPQVEFSIDGNGRPSLWVGLKNSVLVEQP
jgi:hypothetical protein